MKGNVLINPGQYGINNTGGHHITTTENVIIAKRDYWTNVGIANYDPDHRGECHTMEISRNRINWIRGVNGADAPNEFHFDHKNCSFSEFDNSLKDPGLHQDFPAPAGSGINNL